MNKTPSARSAGGFRVWPYVARPLDARKMHQAFLRGRKNAVVQREKGRSPCAQRTSDAMRLRREPARHNQRTHVPHPAHSAPAILLPVGRACPRPPQAGYARNVQSSTQNKKPSAEFAPRANNYNKIPSEGVYLGGNSQFSPNTERLAYGQPFRVKSSRCAARIRARRGRRRRCRSRRC